MISIKEQLNTLPQKGKLEFIGLRSERRGDVVSVDTTRAIEGLGLEGDHRTRNKDNKKVNLRAKRQVTLLQAEHLPVVRAVAGLDRVEPEQLRRNLVVSGINLLALKDRTFYVGEVLLEGTGPCHPCTRMEEALGPGGLNAVRGHGGITARILRGGELRLGDEVRLAPSEAESQE